MLSIGGALFGASLAEGSRSALAAPSAAVGPQLAPVMMGSVAQPLSLQRPSFTRERVIAAVALVLLLGAGGLIAYPWLTHRGSAPLQASSAGSHPGNTLGHAIAPRVDPQLHLVSLGQRFALSHARVSVQAAHVCQSAGNVLVDVPAAVQRLHRGEVISEPEYQLLDSGGVPHQPLEVIPLDVSRASTQHAVPPPAVYHESIDFKLPAASARGALKLQAVLASGSGPEYRVTVADASHRIAPSAGNATCISPGGQGA
jgi:hypothetical protein